MRKKALAALVGAAEFDLEVRVRQQPEQLASLTGPVGQRVRRRRCELVAAAAAHGIANLRVFGSVARGQDRPDSDAIGSHMKRGTLSDGLVFDAVRIRLLEIGEAVKALPGTSSRPAGRAAPRARTPRSPAGPGPRSDVPSRLPGAGDLNP